MPNHVTNIVRVSGDPEKVKAMFEDIKDDRIGLGSIDFNKVIPMPEHIFRGNLGMAEREKYGKDNWYDWSISNWGTKWNSYGYDGAYTLQDFDGEHIEFQTAWSCADPVIRTLAEQYLDLSFEYLWADEDFGHNTGKKEYENGEEMFCDIPPGGSKEALELAAEIHDVDLADEGYLYNEETGEYEYHNPDESMSLKM
ncbi:hypothetical protein [Oscillibacter sp.]|uniref:DUF1281 family ferredoxin-like fold protein n=1 Tax=Oscillibacter sp. TaxID=1945593 RepID=UPI00289D0CB8|nr:hypothetical protein [Oscillibacter sp.]